jgi:SAM-dependent methyltransferase
MNLYTKTTKIWLEERFKETTESNIYFAHQPIYGFRDPNSEKYVINRYIITYQIIKALSHIKFDSLLDVGGAEGYKAAMIKSLLGVRVRNCDISKEACKRAKEIFMIESDTIDIQKLPYKDSEFDVVLCSETLEHVADFEAAVNELIRVCKKAVIITVPNEPQEVIDYNIKNNIPHAHIHSIHEKSFDFIKDKMDIVLVKKILHPILNLPSAVIEASKKESSSSSYSEMLIKFYHY